MQGPLFLIALVWGILNYRPYCWRSHTWLEEIYNPAAPKLDYAYVDETTTIKLREEGLMIYSNCMHVNKHNMFLLGFIANNSPGFSTCLLWYAETLLRFAYVVFLEMNWELPDPLRGFSKQARKIMSLMKRVMTTTRESVLTQGRYLLCSSINVVAQLVSFDGEHTGRHVQLRLESHLRGPK